MKKLAYLLLITLFLGACDTPSETGWTAKRISVENCDNSENTWINFRKEIKIRTLPEKALAKIASDSKYWLWINDELVVFEGQLKRGPSPSDTYYDEVDIRKYLHEGKNTFAVLVWHFGKEGFSHKNSGQAGLVFDCADIKLYSNDSWQARLDVAYGKMDPPPPNFRLPEANLQYDASKNYGDWHLRNSNPEGFSDAVELGEADSKPWNTLVKRPIPLWKDYGVSDYENGYEIPAEGSGEWVVCKLPYNCHVTPILEIEADEAGKSIVIETDNYDYLNNDKQINIRAEYITKAGAQSYESLGWLNGHVVKYLIPEGVKIKSLKYRETGYDCDFTGSFECDDPFYNHLWQKALRTLYVTMRDTYMDCPDRERAQWWGDLVNESGEAFYALSPEAADLTKKGMLELINWQREDGTLFSPIPAGNWDKELPGQMLASIGYSGFWNYYMNTGDLETIREVYEGVKTYLNVWELQKNGILVERQGDWYWGDWGVEVDKQLLFNAWYFHALKGAYFMARELGENLDMDEFGMQLRAFRGDFNAAFWDGKGYRTSNYEGKYDDRAQALAVVTGLADKSKHPQITKIFKSSFLSSPYMEKYVLEALFMMGEADYGLERMKKRFYYMVEESPYSTLWENFFDETGERSRGTNNHAWSGGGLTILSQYVCGLVPIEAGWARFKVQPQLGSLKYAETANLTVKGYVSVRAAQRKNICEVKVRVPAGTECEVYLDKECEKVYLGRQLVYSDGKYTEGFVKSMKEKKNAYVFVVEEGDYHFVGMKK